ncbi:phage protein [Domibacillus iocasae]|uniref:Phage tail protein n=1 Tax=Domibacillus iocasae TaxID=1714016 RepID=A0A1E7DQ94_9BACI|nr:hypothetical protein [Domibacillus iocasae]OES45224.1 hypothetical protein BA724_04240 [Domibacillus iocasae]
MNFGRYCKVAIDTLSLDSDMLTHEFEVPFDNDTEPNESTISIYNLKKDTINRIKQTKKLVLSAGYKGDIGTILNGHVSTVITDASGADRATKITVLDSTPLDNAKTVSKTFKANIKADQIIKDLAALLKLNLHVLNLPNNKTYKTGFTAEGEIMNIIRDVARSSGASFYINKQKIVIRPIHVGDPVQFILKPETGLIGSPEYFEDELNGQRFKGYKIRCQLQPRITTASIIRVESKVFKGRLYVRNGVHRWSNSDFITEMDAIL